MNRGDENGEVPEEDEKYSKARKELIELEKYENFNINDKTEASGLGDEVSFDDWIYDEIDDIFDISSRRIGRDGLAEPNSVSICHLLTLSTSR